jgi:membrane fusion protein, multidrug efflux system
MGPDIRHVVVCAVAAALLIISHAAWSEEDQLETEVAVTVARVQKTTLRAYVTAYGYVETAPAGQGVAPAGARIASPVAGVVSEVTCYEGLQVDKGDVLCSLDSRIASAEFEKARQSLLLAEKAFQRQKELRASDATSEKTFQEAETQLATARGDLAAAQIRLSQHRITAPFAGIITRLNVRPGESVDAASVVAEIADLSRLVAALQLPASEASVLKPGQSVEIKTENGDDPVIGTLASISSRVDAGDGAMTAYAALPVDTLLKPGRFVSARITCDEHRDCMVVPETSLVKDAEGGWIIAVVEGGKATHMKVTTGFRDNGLV